MKILIDFLRSWVINIVVLVIFLSFLDMILPKSNMKRYINMIAGLLIIIVLINPFINLLTKDIDIEREVFSNIIESNNIGENTNENISKIQDQQVIEIYKGTLKKEISELINTKTEYVLSDISIDIEEDKEAESFGKIKKVSLILSNNKRSQSDEDIKVKVDSIKDVSVNVDTKKMSDTSSSSKEFEEVRKIISDSYSIPQDQILVGKN
ncbi:stage III sporulation protein AF [Sporosalibacterium faouarense]|uniref:stage III sporulation protein AF n=1 Tax=Sporosalibacterium faouarense TaxID=516123 RepID=UPI001A9C7F7D